jgi:hypothetical protein
MDLWFYITLIVAFSLIYYGYDKKKSYELKGKEIELEQMKIELEMKKLDKGFDIQRKD